MLTGNKSFLHLKNKGDTSICKNYVLKSFHSNIKEKRSLFPDIHCVCISYLI